MVSRLRINSLLLALITLVLIVMELRESSEIWQALLVALGGAWLISYLWANSLRKNLFLERTMRFGWAQVGDKLEEELILFNDGIFPATWLEVIDRSTLPGYSISRATGVD